MTVREQLEVPIAQLDIARSPAMAVEEKQMNAWRRSWFRDITLVMAAVAPFAASAASPAGDYDDTSYPDVVMQRFQWSDDARGEAPRASEGDARVAHATTTAPSPCSCCT